MLSFDIQGEIIKNLPVKSLIRFRSLCKAWKSLIDSSHFIVGYNAPHHHLLIRYEIGYREKNEVKYVCFVDDDDDDDDDTFPQQRCALNVPRLIQIEGTNMLGSSHGLLCFTSYYRDSNDSSRYRTQMAVLWNPAISKSIAVAVPNRVFAPFNSDIGFGVCPDTKDPMLVKITYIEESWNRESINRIPCQVMIFTLSSGKWSTSSRNNLPRKSIKFTDVQTNIGQFIYWLACYPIDDDEFRDDNLIMSFDMSTQVFREIDLPDCLVGVHEPTLFVSNLRESLAVVECSNLCFITDSREANWVVWIMEDSDSKAFTKLFTINPPTASVLQTIGFRKNGEPIVDVLEDGKKNYEISVYDPFSKQIKDLGISGPKHSLYGSSYTESLLLLDHDDGHILWCKETTLGTG